MIPAMLRSGRDILDQSDMHPAVAVAVAADWDSDTVCNELPEECLAKRVCGVRTGRVVVQSIHVESLPHI